MKRMIAVMMILLLSIVIIGCKEEAKEVKVREQVERPPLEVKESEPIEYLVDEAEPPEQENEEPEEQPEPSVRITHEPYCGDGTCDIDENCGSCWNDCRCVSPEECHRNECVKPECGSNGDCPDDDDACTYATCYFAGHPNAYCDQKEVTSCKNSDDCCPKRCNADNDNDCEAHCGNEVCETGEDADDCPKDCQVCGDGRCDGDETPNTCQQDCV